MILDRDDLVRADHVHRNALRAKAAQEILLQLGSDHGVVYDDVDLRTDDLAFLDECTPARIGQRPRMVGSEDIRARHGTCLAVLVELLERRLVDGERGDARLPCTGEDFAGWHALTRGKLQEPLVVDGKLHRTRILLDFVTLHADEETRNEANEDRREEDRMIVKFLHR